MSFLTSLLSDIDPSVATEAPTLSAKPSQVAKNPKAAQSQTTETTATTPAPQTKRKAESDAAFAPNKIQRRDAPNGINGIARPVQGANGSKPKVQGTPDPLPYRGTATAAAKPSNAPKLNQKRTPDPVPKPTTGGMQTLYTGSGPAVKKAAAPQAPPKAGSYAAILARAKEAQTAKPAVPIIKHKPAEIVTKKERLARQAEAKGKKVPGVDRKPALNGHGKAIEPGRARAGLPGEDKPRPKPADLGYQGTMRPKPTVESGYQGTMRGGPQPQSKRAGAGPVARRGSTFDRSRSGSLAAKAKPAGHRGGMMAGRSYYSESDDEEEDDYGSDASSDMEAGAWDVEEEERRALLTAKKEDEEELKRENELKRLKAERKKKGLN